jgi:hypothetical protein
MNDHVAVVNAALVKLGVPPITSFDDDVKSAATAKLRYPSLRAAALSLHRWHFAKDRASLTPLSSVPLFGYSNQFQLPSECLRLLKVVDVTDYRIEGQRILANETLLNIEFTRDVENPAQWTVYFTELMVAMIAKEFALPLTQSDTVRNTMAEEFNFALRRAKYTNSTEAAQSFVASEQYLDSRLNRFVDINRR